MALTTHFFAGANSGSGFQSYFFDVIDPEMNYDCVLLKGGPGVGKSTLIRTLGQAMEATGQPVEYLWCSGDPESLDGVVLPQLRCAVIDATSPHAVEPKYPAAVDRYLDLGCFYDLTAAKAEAAAIKRETNAYQEAYRQAYRCLRAARELELGSIESAAQTADHRRLQRRFSGIAKRELQKRGKEQGVTRRRFLGSFTHKGYIWQFGSVAALCDRVYVLEDRFELAGPFLEQLRLQAMKLGWDCIACGAPEAPGRWEHLLIPGLRLGFVTQRPGMEYPQKAYRHIRLDALTSPADKGRLRLQQRLVKALRSEAQQYLQEAKEHHDALEQIHNPYVDFHGVQRVAALETGRFLSYLQ